MNFPKIFRAAVSCDSDYDEVPAAVEFSIDEATAKDIVQLAQLVKTNGLYKVEKFDYRATYLQHDPEENPEDAENGNDVRTDADTLNVTDTEFWFAAYIKHTNVEVLSEHQRVDELAQHFGLDTGGSNPL